MYTCMYTTCSTSIYMHVHMYVLHALLVYTCMHVCIKGHGMTKENMYKTWFIVEVTVTHAIYHARVYSYI